MKSSDYKTNLGKLPFGVLDGLRQMTEWVDTSLNREHRRDIRFSKSSWLDDSGLLASVFGELTGQIGDSGAQKIIESLLGSWNIFTDNGDDTITLQYKNFVTFKATLKKVLRSQPYGYPRELSRPKVKEDVTIVLHNEKVYVNFNDGTQVLIGKLDTTPAKLLLALGRPLGSRVTIKSIMENFDTDNENALTNAMREVSRKLAAKQKRRTLSLKSDGNLMWLEV